HCSSRQNGLWHSSSGLVPQRHSGLCTRILDWASRHVSFQFVRREDVEPASIRLPRPFRTTMEYSDVPPLVRPISHNVVHVKTHQNPSCPTFIFRRRYREWSCEPHQSITRAS